MQTLPNAYRICGRVLTTNVGFPELAEVNGTEAQWSFRLLPASSPPPRLARPFHHWRLSDGATWLVFGKCGGDYLLRFPELADFLVSADGKQIRCRPSDATPLQTIRHLLLDQVVPLVLGGLGFPVLHGSAVRGPKGAICFVGTTGSGKSTLAAALCDQGCSLLTDDCLLLEEVGDGFRVIPSYPGLRLWPETAGAVTTPQPALPAVAHYTDKRRLPCSGRFNFCSDPVPLGRIYFVAPPEEAALPGISVRAVAPREVLMELLRCGYLLDVTDRGKLRMQFESFSRLAVLPVFHRLCFPHDFAALPAVRKALLEHARGPHGGGKSRSWEA